jgi:putative redox protein
MAEGVSMAPNDIEFINAEGHRLSARLDLPTNDPPGAYALFAHCFTCSKHTKAIGHISRALTEEGIAVLRFDFTGLGESEGEFADTSLSSNVDDLVAAADFLTDRFRAPKIIIGHSFGGAAVLLAAAGIPSAAAVATIAAPADPGHVSRLLGSSRREIETRGEARLQLAGRSFVLKKQFLEDLQSIDMQTRLRELNRALLIFHSPVDDVVDIENAARIFRSARHPKSFVSLDTADHMLSDNRDARYVGAVIAAWAGRYLERSPSRERRGPVADRRDRNA